MEKAKIRIKLRSYDRILLDIVEEKIVSTVKAVGAEVDGPMPLPVNKKNSDDLNLPHPNKKFRDQLSDDIYIVLLDIYTKNSFVIEVLMRLNLPSAVDIDIKA